MSTFEPAHRFRDIPFPEVRLIASSAAEIREPHPEAVRIVDTGGRWRVTGPAASGVSRIVVDTVVECVRRGVRPSKIAVIAHSKETGASLRGDIADQCAHLGFASEGPVVRSVHSFAFSIIQKVMHDAKLITGAEQDAVIRELLLGHIEHGGGPWPTENRDALGFVGFARGLRDFLLRAVERGVSPEDLERLGQEYQRPLWSAAGTFLREYEQTMELAGIRSFNASELVTAALDTLQLHPEVLADVHRQLQVVIIDDAQHLDPRAAELISTAYQGAKLVVLAGDPEQSVFRFRGARPDFLMRTPVDYELRLPEPLFQPNVRAVIAEHPGTQIALVADTLRRAHLFDGVSWRDQAVIVRSAGQIGAVRRGLLAAGVPVHIDPTDVVLSEQRIVAALILAVHALSRDLTHEELEELVLGPVGGADPVTLRRLLRGLRHGELALGGHRRALDVLADVVLPTREPGDLDVLQRLTERELAVLERIRSVLAAGYEARNDSIEQVLWVLWEATGLSDSFAARSLRGGPGGSQADRDLDAVMSLFDAAGDYIERFPQASLASFIRHIEEQQLPTGKRDRRGGEPDAVQLLTAHATGGRHWHTVCVVGVQEGVWPSLGETGSLFGQEEFIDLLDENIDPNQPISRAVERLREEERLFHLACSRAKYNLLVSAVASPESNEVLEPSRFLETLGVEVTAIGDAGESASMDEQHIGRLSIASLIAELRRVVCDDAERPRRRRQAARQLARLADAGIYGARPEEWWGVRTPINAKLHDQESPARLSPSRIEAIEHCPLKAVLGNLETEEDTPIHLLRGTLVHAFAEAVARGVNTEQAKQIVTEAYQKIVNEPEWKQASTLSEWNHLIDRTNLWLKTSRSVFTQVGVEMPLLVTIGRTSDGQQVMIKGRMDRLERDGESLVVVDLKTGKTMPPEKTMHDHAQLAAYQLALSRGVVDDDKVRGARAGETPAPVGGGVLVFPAPDQKNVPTRTQVALEPEELDALAARLPELAMEIRGPELTARINETCANCNLRSVCPVQPEGRMTTHV
ncbi:ATP-dependent DNA helicase [Corynebacterium freiburgense]|uniref:ATP-dependent DNA helicase n=1 Tax=Corynebacterium freiburgense TaxID=556548 RepID=UPI0004036E11|nr:ATP-dependent DNA helicase [Corynebacterium freiburgense]WJZ01945.1 ATP-dependent DNA helicase PcrA [Corynebacterium freiburgense]